MRGGHAIDNGKLRENKMIYWQLVGISLALYSLGQAGNKKVGDGEVRPIAYENAG